MARVLQFGAAVPVVLAFAGETVAQAVGCGVIEPPSMFLECCSAVIA